MTDTAPAPAPLPDTRPSSTKQRNIVGLVALGVAVLTFLLAVIPPTSFIAWIPAIAAIVLAIVGLTRKNQTKGTSIAAIVIAPIAWIIAITVALGTTVLAVDSAINGSPSAGTATEAAAPTTEGGATSEEPAPSEAPATAGIGTAVTSPEGVSYTVSGITCGIATAGPEYFVETASGQFCEVKATMANGGKDSFDMWTANVKGYIDGNEYDPNSSASSFGGESFTKTVNPGLSIDMVLYFDVPADKTLQSIEFSETSFFGGDPVAINLQ